MHEELKQKILKLCMDNVSFRTRLKIFGVLTFTIDGMMQFIKFDEFLTFEEKINKLSNGKMKNKRKIKSPVKVDTNIRDKPKNENQANLREPIVTNLIQSTITTPSPKKHNVESLFRKRRRTFDDQLHDEEIGEYLGAGQNLDTNIYCTLCHETMQVAHYFQHCRNMHNVYVCHTCLKHFSTKSCLLRHRPIHTGLRRYACKICKRAFYRRDKCKGHAKRHLMPHLQKDADLEELISSAVIIVEKCTNIQGKVVFNISCDHEMDDFQINPSLLLNDSSASDLNFTTQHFVNSINTNLDNSLMNIESLASSSFNFFTTEFNEPNNPNCIKSTPFVIRPPLLPKVLSSISPNKETFLSVRQSSLKNDVKPVVKLLSIDDFKGTNLKQIAFTDTNLSSDNVKKEGFTDTDNTQILLVNDSKPNHKINTINFQSDL
ncbi:hypothetical protein A3Q56_07491 [Intoshia linei]|uniref:C2H2-type domain-containing protein n=1 Tax=Intoshia linei TaxID=1819745 RepID=A0A177AS03_9BILA|nr:hypothetical protein A3Q56_07491 [Intoshia linei]